MATTDMHGDEGRLMLVADVCERYSVTRRTVYRWVGNGMLHARKAGRKLYFDKDDVDGLLKECAPSTAKARPGER